jgi:hypothetical protein
MGPVEGWLSAREMVEMGKGVIDWWCCPREGIAFYRQLRGAVLENSLSDAI